MPVLKAGPLTQAELLEVWKSAVDKAYRDPLLLAGEGEGLEVHTQMLAQLERVSRAVDTTTQAMFICPWSGQSDEPAAGERKATVTLTFQRTKLFDKPLVLRAGLIFVGEELLDMSPEGSIEVQTGRRYVLTQDLVFNPGDAGPFDVIAVAELPGYGHNNPLPGTIKDVSQPGNNFENDLATVTVALGAIATNTQNQAKIVTPNEPDTFIPEHIGQYVFFTSGMNVGKVGRVTSFVGPDLVVFPPIGSTVEIAWEQSFEGSTFAGTFQAGEIVENAGPTKRARVLGSRVVAGKKRITLVAMVGTFAVGDVMIGAMSGATLTVETASFPQDFVAEAPVGSVGGAAWRVLDWAEDWGLEVTNALSPTGGKLGFLDELGNERNLHRSPGESDDVYRQRIKAIADVVTPNAIRRTLARTMGTYPYCFREVGTDLFRGFFYDGDRSPVGTLTTLPVADLNDAWDTWCVLFVGTLTSGTFNAIPTASFNEPAVLEDAINNVSMSGYFGRMLSPTLFVFVPTNGRLPASVAGLRIRGLVSGALFAPTSASIPSTAISRRWRVWLDYANFRGYFIIGVPRLGAGEFGFPYDQAPANAYDASPYNAFYDGYAVQAALFYQRIYQAINTVKAGGVGFDLYIEEIGCP